MEICRGEKVSGRLEQRAPESFGFKVSGFLGFRSRVQGSGFRGFGWSLGLRV